MKTYSFDEVKDKYLGKIGTKERGAYENELRLDLIGGAIKEAQISKIENNLTDARFEIILKVFRALNAKVNFNVVLQNQKLDLC